MFVKTVQEAKERIKDYVVDTELLYAKKLSALLEGDIYLKLENFQNSGAFKMRGACNKVLSLTKEEREKGIIASSAGNHAQGVACTATALGIKSTIVMPKGAPLAKISATRDYGAQVVLHGDIYDEAYAKAREIQEKEDLVFIHPFDDEVVIAGQATIGLEILNELDNIDQIIVPIGGGGLIAGIAAYVKAVKPSIKVIGVQAFNAPAMKVSFNNKERTSYKVIPTIADGIGVANPGVITFDYILKYVDEIVTVPEEEIAKAILFLMEKCKMVSEGAGAICVAAMLSEAVEVKGLRTVGIISGGNIDATLFEKIVNKALISAGRRAEIKINLEDKAGQLARLVTVIAGVGANITSIKQGPYRKGLKIAEQGVTVVIDTENKDQLDSIYRALKKDGFNII